MVAASINWVSKVNKVDDNAAIKGNVITLCATGAAITVAAILTSVLSNKGNGFALIYFKVSAVVFVIGLLQEALNPNDDDYVLPIIFHPQVMASSGYVWFLGGLILLYFHGPWSYLILSLTTSVLQVMQSKRIKRKSEIINTLSADLENMELVLKHQKILTDKQEIISKTINNISKKIADAKGRVETGRVSRKEFIVDMSPLVPPLDGLVKAYSEMPKHAQDKMHDAYKNYTSEAKNLLNKVVDGVKKSGYYHDPLINMQINLDVIESTEKMIQVFVDGAKINQSFNTK